MNRFSPLHFSPIRQLLPALLGAGTLLLVGCKNDGSGANPNPSPSPSPGPTASPTASPTPADTSISSESVGARSASSYSGPELQVVKTNADIIHAAARDALDEVTRLQSLLNVTAPTSAGLADADAALSSAYQAFLLAEAAVYYPEPDADAAWSRAFLVSGPSPASPETPGFAAVGRWLKEFASIPPGVTGYPSPRSVALGNLQSEISALRNSLQDFVANWDAYAPDNYRNQTFLTDSQSAIGRIFEALLVETDLLILEQAGSPDRDRVVGRLEGIKSLYTGTYQSLDHATILSPGPDSLVQQSDPAGSQALIETLDLLLSTWRGSDSIPGEEAAKSLKHLRKQIVSAAETLGYPVQPQ